jgi:hypothetical protein
LSLDSDAKGEPLLHTDTLHPGRTNEDAAKTRDAILVLDWKDGCPASPGDAPVPLFAVVAKIAASYAEVLKQYLRAELLQYRAQYLGKKVGWR